MKLSNKAYDIANWGVKIVLPACFTLYGAIGAALGWNTETVLMIGVAVQTFLGTVLGISNVQYNKQQGEL